MKVIYLLLIILAWANILLGNDISKTVVMLAFVLWITNYRKGHLRANDNEL